MHRNLPNAFWLTAFMILLTGTANAQCGGFISNLPDTIPACKNTTVHLSAVVNGAGSYYKMLDTTWTPAAGLSNFKIINPVATVGTTSTGYKLTVRALTANNYVANGNFSGGNTGFSSSYSYVTGTNSVYPEATYSITSNPNLVHNGFASFYDHTSGTSAGKMMVVNGSSVPNTSIWCQTITVQPNTDYDFSAWGATCVASAPAILQFSINGTLLGTPLSLPTTTAQWTQFHALWNSGSNTSITICIVDQQTATSGNDFAIDDIEFRQVCQATDSVYIPVTNMQPGINKTVKFGCISDTLTVDALNFGGQTPDQYVWDFGDGTGAYTAHATHVYSTQGTYNVKLVTKKNNCADSSSVTIDTQHPLTVGLKSSKDSVCAGEKVDFTNTDNGTTTLSYIWDFGDGSPVDNTSAPSHTYPNAGTYTVTHVVTDQVPCSDTARKTIMVAPGPTATFDISDTVLCQGQSTMLTSTVSDGFKLIAWTFGDGDSIHGLTKTAHAYDKSGKYTVNLRVEYPVCPTAYVSKDIQIMPVPHINVGKDTSLCPYSEPIYIFNSINEQNVSYLWNTGSTGNSTMANEVGVYWLQGTSDFGCTASDSLEVFRSCYLDIPNAFTPNGDGANDYFFPRQFLSSKLKNFHMQIFNRWGEIIFETTNINGRGWDGKCNGKDQPTGVYVYMIDAQIEGMAPEKYRGNVTLMR